MKHARAGGESRPIVGVPVAPELQEEIRAAMEQDDCDHVALPYQILVLVRIGLRFHPQLMELRDQAVKKCVLEELQRQQGFPGSVSKHECRILPFPRQE